LSNFLQNFEKFDILQARACQIFKFDNKQQQAAMAGRKSSKKGKAASKKAPAQQEIAVPQAGMQ
jgi:hypothetical protein